MKKKSSRNFSGGFFHMEDKFIRGAEEAGHDWKGGLKRNADDLAMILENLGNRVRQIIWGERVWQKGEVKGTKVMEDAYLAGKRIGE